MGKHFIRGENSWERLFIARNVVTACHQEVSFAPPVAHLSKVTIKLPRTNLKMDLPIWVLAEYPLDAYCTSAIAYSMSSDRGVALWIVSDNLRKGAALNAVQIAEQAIEMGVIPK